MLIKDIYYENKAEKKHTNTILFGILFFTFALMLSYVSANIFIILIIGMLPGIVAVSVDTHPSRYLSKIVIMFNLVGIFPHIARIIFLGGDQDDFMISNELTYPYIWFSIYASAAFGWIIYICIPKITYHFTVLSMEAKSKKLQEELDEILSEWGKSKVLNNIEDDPENNNQVYSNIS